MKTKIVGWLFIIASPIMLFVFLAIFVPTYLFKGGLFDSLDEAKLGLFALFLGIVSFILGSGIKAHKRWAWYLGIVTSVLLLFQSIFLLVTSFSIAVIVGLLIDAFYIYSLITERSLFFSIKQMSTIPQPQPVNQQVASPPPLQNIQNSQE